MTSEWIIVSDDLTGLQAIAGEFARFGFRVGTGISQLPCPADLEQCEVYGFDTATRACPGTTAQALVSETMRHFLGLGAQRFFKHNDSILQGHIGLELRAMAQARGEMPIVYAPACPNRGRVTQSGFHLEVDQSGAPLPGGLRHDLRECVSRGTGLSTLVMDRASLHDNLAADVIASARCDVLIADATTDRDLDLIVSAARQAGCRVVSGSVGAAAALARAMLPTSRFACPVLVVAGSLQPATQEQVRKLLSRPDCTGVSIDVASGGTGAGDRIERIRDALSRGLHCVIWTPRESEQERSGYPSLPEELLAGLRRELGALLTEVIADPKLSIGGLVLAGGTTADVTMREVMRVTRFTHLGWLCEGMTVAIAADGARPGLRVVTKSGGWGASDALCDAIDRLAGGNGAGVRHN